MTRVPFEKKSSSSTISNFTMLKGRNHKVCRNMRSIVKNEHIKIGVKSLLLGSKSSKSSNEFWGVDNPRSRRWPYVETEVTPKDKVIVLIGLSTVIVTDLLTYLLKRFLLSSTKGSYSLMNSINKTLPPVSGPLWLFRKSKDHLAKYYWQ